MTRNENALAALQQFLDSGRAPTALIECVVFDAAVARGKEAQPLALWPRQVLQQQDSHLEMVDRLFALAPSALEQLQLPCGADHTLSGIYLPHAKLIVSALWRGELAAGWLSQWQLFDTGASLQSQLPQTEPGLGARLAVRLLDAEDYATAVQTWLADLNAISGAEKSLLFINRAAQLELDSVSGVGQFESRRHLLAKLAEAAQEAFDQYAPVVDGDSRDEGTVRLAQQAFNREFAPLRVSSLPLYGADNSTALTLAAPLAVLVLLHREPIDTQLCVELERVVADSSAALMARKRLDKSFIAALQADAGRFFAGLLGRELLRAKLLAAGLLLVIAVASLWPIDEQLSVTAELLPEQQQRISAQLDGYLRSAEVKEGDRVEAGQLLAELDSRDLVLERLQRLSRFSRIESEYLQAVAFGAQGEMAVLQARLTEAEAELELIDQQLQRLRISSPVSALVISGDLSQRLGDPVKAGELLFLLATLDDFKVRLKIPEYRLDAIRVGARGELFLNARTERSYRFEVSAVKPQLVAEQGGNFLLVDAKLLLSEESVSFQPGMVGVARVEVGRASALAVWTRQLNYVVGRFLWRWFGIG